MIFGDKKNSKRTAQLKSVLEDAVDEALKRQARELARQQEGQNAYLSEGIEKNQKAIRSLADTVEDFLDTLQEADEAGRQSRQVQESAAKREQRLLELVGLYQQQMELFEQWTLGQEHEMGDAGKEAWQQQLSMLKGKIAAESRLCAIEMTGFAGEMVDYRLHEVLQADEPETREQEGTIAKVHSQGMIYQGTVVRKARVTAYRKA
jgi:molecular chaperone GrpE (heat shock protein)|nr:hypothetical protein [uncultured Acetatifactor sp.]